MYRWVALSIHKDMFLEAPKNVQEDSLGRALWLWRKCAYNHKRRSHGQSVDDDAIKEEVHKLKT